MREPRFVKQNSEKWKRLESLMKEKQWNPSELSYYFIEITDDLAFAKTYYPESEVTAYLNRLAASLYQMIYKQQWKQRGEVKRFFLRELPLIFYRARKEILTAFVLLTIAVSIGVVSTLKDYQFARMFLGDNYVNMTLENIKNGDPMAVYKKSNEVDMFLGITYNNVRVTIFVFVAGVVFALGAAYILFTNGIMIGTFLTLCYTEGVLGDAMLTVWVHGTLEISCIVIAGGAGFLLGKGFLFPKSYGRLYSFRMHALMGVKILLGVLTFIVTAAFIESFFTRYTEWDTAAKLFFSVGSLVFVIYYIIIYPIQMYRKAGSLGIENNITP